MTLDSSPASFQRSKNFRHVHTSYVNSLAFSPDGSLLASSSPDGTLIIIDVRQREVIMSVQFGKSLYPTCLLWPEEKMLVVGRYDGGVQLLEVTLEVSTQCITASVPI